MDLLMIKRFTFLRGLACCNPVAAALVITRSQFHSRQELESLARFGTRLDDATRKTLEHGKRIREILKQNQFSPLTAHDQVAILMAANKGLLDDIPLEKIAEAEKKIITALQNNPELAERIYQTEQDDSVWQDLETMLQEVVVEFKGG